MKLVHLRAKDIPTEWRPKLLSLTIPDAFAMSRWLYQDGSCWACICFEDDSDMLLDGAIVGWACLTCEDGEYPVVGAYVAGHKRRRGYATACVQLLLHTAREAIRARGGVVQAVASAWPRYREIIHFAGFRHVEWE